MIYATNISGGPNSYPGVGKLRGGERRPITPAIAAQMLDNNDFRLEIDAPEDVPLRDSEGQLQLGLLSAVTPLLGYGYGGVNIIRALRRQNARLRVNRSLGINMDKHDPEVSAALQERSFFPRIELMHATPTFYHRATAPIKVAWTMWETSEIPHSDSHPMGDWVTKLNAVDLIIVPSDHSKEVFQEAGVRTKIHIVPYGVDVDEWPLMDRPNRDTITFFQWGDLSSRKGPLEALEAFQRAFPDDDDVQLVFKTIGGKFGGAMNPVFKDRRISLISNAWTQDQLRAQLYNSDAMIWLSRGEGFGLPPLQAALTGLPVITTTHTGMAEYYNANLFYGVESIGQTRAPQGGLWYEPNIEQAAEQMRIVRDDIKNARKRGKAASTSLRKRFNLEVFGRNILDALTPVTE